MLGNAFLLAFRQILRNPMRSLLTVLGIVIGVASVITMVTVGNGATVAVREQIESFGSNQLMLRRGQRLGPGGAAGAPSFKIEDINALEDQIAGVISAAPQINRSTIVVANGRNWTTSVVGSSVDYFATENRSLAEGRYFEEAEEISGAAVCVIGTTIQRELFGAGAPVLGEMLRINAFSCRIIGLLDEKGTAAMGNDQDDLVVLPFNTAARRLVGNNRVNNVPKIETNEEPTVKYAGKLDVKFDQDSRVHDIEGIAPTIRASKGQCHSPMIEESTEGDTAQDIITASGKDSGIIIAGKLKDSFAQDSRVHDVNGASPTIMSTRPTHPPMILDGEGGDSDD